MVFEYLIEVYSAPRYGIFTTLVNVVVGLSMVAFLYYLVRHNTIPKNVALTGTFLWSILGISIRLLADVFSISMPWRMLFITPFVYLEVYVIALLTYFLLRNHIRVWYSLPVVFTLIPLGIFLLYSSTFRIIYFLIVGGVSYSLFLILHHYFKELRYSLPITFQFMDGFTTFIATTFLGFYEEQLFAHTFISFIESLGLVVYGSGSWAFVVLKFLVSVVIVYALRHSSLHDNEKDWVLWFIAFIGFVTGTRNLFNIVFV